MKTNNTLHNETKLYLAHLQFERKLSINTINSYWLDLKFYTNYLTDVYNIDNFNNIKTRYIKNYIQSLSKIKNNNLKENATLNRVISSIKNFHKYLFLNKKCNNNPSKILKSIKRIII